MADYRRGKPKSFELFPTKCFPILANHSKSNFKQKIRHYWILNTKQDKIQLQHDLAAPGTTWHQTPAEGTDH